MTMNLLESVDVIGKIEDSAVFPPK